MAASGPRRGRPDGGVATCDTILISCEPRSFLIAPSVLRPAGRRVVRREAVPGAATVPGVLLAEYPPSPPRPGGCGRSNLVTRPQPKRSARDPALGQRRPAVRIRRRRAADRGARLSQPAGP